MKPEVKAQSLFSKRLTRRSILLGGLQLSTAVALASRVRYLQVNEADKFQLLAEENRINVRIIPPHRGLIYDIKGRIIAQNSPNYKIIIVPEEAGDTDHVLQKLQNIIHIPANKLSKIKTEISRRNPFVPITVIENLNWEDFSKVAVNSPALPGVLTEVGLSREYPQNDNLAHVVGYVGPVSDHYLANNDDDDPLLKIPRFQVGKTGVEARKERLLRGKAGNQKIEVNALGRVMRKLERQEGEIGASLQLTIDSKLQSYALARMQGYSASAVVMDCKTGNLISIGSAPTFDPNLFVRGISTQNYGALRDNPLGPLRAKAIQGTYAPGSTFKMVVALAALEAGVLDPEMKIECTGNIEVSNNVFNCWKSGGHGKMDIHQSLLQSCDVFYYTIAQEVGIEKIARMARMLGLGTLFDLPLSAVQHGVAPDREWKRRNKDEAWLIGDTVNASIGQGYVLASPMQLAVMTARIASGRALSPQLINRVDNIAPNLTEAPILDINPENLNIVRKAMFGAVNERKGTAYKTRVNDDDLRSAGKTGTAQVRRITAKERETGVIKNEDLPWNRRDHALHVSYAPYHDPQIAVSVVVEHGGSGSAVAAPIARDISLFALTGEIPRAALYPREERTKAQRIHKEIAPKLKQFDQINSDGADRA